MAGLTHPTLAVAALVAATAAAVYLHVGLAFYRRPTPPEARLPLRMFALWWLATGVNILLGASFIAAAAFGATDLWLQSTYSILQRLLLAAALLGLVHYLLVLVRGRAPFRTLLVFYAAYGMLLIGTLYANDPVGVYVGDWRTDLVYAHESPAWVNLLSVALLILPPVGLSIAAMAVSRRLAPSQRPQRNRITLVALAVITWWIVAVLAGQREAFGSEYLQVFNRFLGLSMALVVLAAYDSPAWLRPWVATPAEGD
jgi:hypothetical protein